jgi:hypothetical protein
MCSNIPASPAYGVYILQLIRYARASSNYSAYLYTFLYENPSFIFFSAETEYMSTRSWYRNLNFLRDRKYCYSDSRNLWTIMRAGGLALYNLIQPTISLEMPEPSQGHYGFHSFSVVDWFFHQHTLQTESSTKYLGVTIQSDLKWNKHLDNISSTASKHLKTVHQQSYRPMIVMKT